MAALERGQHRLGLVERRIVIARINAPRAVLVVRVADERGRGVDRQRDRARLIVQPIRAPGRRWWQASPGVARQRSQRPVIRS